MCSDHDTEANAAAEAQPYDGSALPEIDQNVAASHMPRVERLNSEGTSELVKSVQEDGVTAEPIN